MRFVELCVLVLWTCGIALGADGSQAEPAAGLLSTNSAASTGEPLGRPPGFVWIKPGTFIMGSPTNEVERAKNEGPATEVTISKGFWIGRYEVTQAEFQKIMGGDRSQFKGDNLPMESVSWFNATNYCRKLTNRERAAGHLPEGHVYRLPTEAEWEYACRAGKITAFTFGSAISSTKANFNGNYPYGGGQPGPYLEATAPVGSFQANAWGVYDMHGNVWEWCQDWFGNYPGGSVTDPTGPAEGRKRVIRGGNWFLMGRYCRSAHRMYDFPGSKDEALGFRVVLARPLP